jgi:hypothetical protein
VRKRDENSADENSEDEILNQKIQKIWIIKKK